jgi:N-acetyl-gamma-glutamyl-phosphate reductase
MRAYKVLSHQHEPEVVRDLERAGGAGFEIAMVPQSGPFARGIFTVAHARVDESVDVAALYAERYRDEFFVRVREGTPTLRHVARTNFCDIAVHRRGGRVVVLSAIDNLGKGMAGQAIQNLNLVFGLDETAGLRTPGGNP